MLVSVVQELLNRRRKQKCHEEIIRCIALLAVKLNCFTTHNTKIDCGIKNIPSIQMPLFASSVFLYKSLKESTVKTLPGEEAISVSSEVSTSFPIPKTNTAAPFFWRRDDAISRGVYSPWSVVCFPVVMTRTGWTKKMRLRETGSHRIKSQTVSGTL